jgi:DNA-directed RNA polymerase specialized sigma24 family protein
MLSMSQVVMRLSGPSLATGDHDASEERFNRLYAEYAEPMRRYLIAHFGSQVSAETLEELHQDLFMKLWGMIGNLEEATVRSLLIRLAMRAGIDQVRSVNYHRNYVEDAPAGDERDDDEDAPNWVISGSVDPVGQAIDRETLAEAIRAAKTPKKLTVLLLIALGFGMAEIETVTGWSQTSIKTLIWRYRHEDWPAFNQAQEAAIRVARGSGEH